MSATVDIRDMSVDECRSFFVSLGEPPYRANQVLEWVYHALASSYQEMTSIPTYLRRRLSEIAPLEGARVLARKKAREGTVKLLVGFADGNAVETVLMPHDYGLSLCVSSQVGCQMGCVFCASGLSGFVRNLSCGEMIAQLIAGSREAGAGRRVNSVVLMGTGEPLANYEQVLKFIRLINWNRGFGVGYRHITLSTCGLVPGIERLAGEGLPITLSVSLHAPDDETRSAIMKVSQVWGVSDVVRACVDYAERTGRRVTYEYSLIAGVNDSLAHADRLAHLIKGTLCHVNLIPLNPVPETGFARSPRQVVADFSKILTEAGIEVTIRREMGTDIDAACGQLRRRELARGKAGRR
ncbi:MAG: 23S rRNA (adenine(2503)-C(2))-methyltransferase RlmN [Firmicutes bacterium]|jgi:23S rRNA (adenine2503-C2)-methyltransferase|nr:23S rRNA (adenine(2503)-C(2))-methyltransferase RlmN [Bacillota bacterium]